MLELRPNCEHCDCDLPGDSDDAWICSFECTFCTRCAHDRCACRCPNCGGELVRRPRRPAAKLQRHPASTTRVHGPVGVGDGASQAADEACTAGPEVRSDATREMTQETTPETTQGDGS